MLNTDLMNMVITNQERIEYAILTGAAWEMWMHTELHIMLKSAGLQVARGVAYPAPYQLQRLDLAAQGNQGNYAIEVRVESAANAGGVYMGALADIAKIRNYLAKNKWVVAIAYSVSEKGNLMKYANMSEGKAIYESGNNIGVMVASI